MMLSRFPLLLLALLLMTALAVLASADAAPVGAADDADKPHDLILAIDVSLSMIKEHQAGNKKLKASDPEGMRWDGLQFAIDVARPEDRIALVLFAGTAEVVSKGIHESGFVELKTLYDDKEKGGRANGRTLLKRAIEKFQQREQEQEKKKEDTKEAIEEGEVNGLPFAVKDGTSIVSALGTIRKKLFLDLKPKHQTWLFLFTDGRETPAPADAEVDGLAEQYVQPFRENNIPLFTFALGEGCDMRLLGAMSRLSKPKGQNARGAANYFAKTNDVLLGQMREVCWALRHTWVVPRDIKPDKRQEEFIVPSVGPWQEVGVLLYHGKSRALAPPEDAVVQGPLVNDKLFGGFKPLRSRSHWYYSLTPADAVRDEMPSNKDIQFRIKHSESEKAPYGTKAFAALRTLKPLFHHREPSRQYTPLDAIHFRIDFAPFLSNGKRVFRAKDFAIEASLVPVNRSVSLPHDGIVHLKPSVADDGKTIIPFCEKPEKLILDPDPDSKGIPKLVGHYHVDVTIEGREGPLKGANLKLLRQTIEVKGYPNLTIASKQIVLTNAEPKAKLEVTLPVLGREGENVANISCRLVPVDEGKLRATDFRISTDKLALVGGKGELTVELLDAAWSRLAVGKFKAAQLEVRSPWESSSPVKIDVMVRKDRYDLLVDDVQFDFSEKDTKAIDVRLKTERDTEEEVWLTTDEKSTEPRSEKEIVVEEFPHPAKGAPRRIPLPATGLGQRFKAVRKQNEANAGKWTLGLTRTPELTAGIYQARLHVRGNGVIGRDFTLMVSVEQPQAFLKGSDKVLAELRLPVLASSRVQRTLIFRKSLGGKELISALDAKLKGQEVLKPRIVPRDDGDDALPLKVSSQSDKVDLRVTVPPTVREGDYTTELTFNLQETAKGTPLRVNLPVKVEVSHGVFPDPQGPLHLRHKNPCDTDYSEDIKLKTSMNRASVRWWWECQPFPNPKGANGALDPKFVEIHSNGKKVAPKDGIADSVSRDKPCTLTIVAHCGGLSPGLYRNRVVFHSYLDDEDKLTGPQNTLDLEFVVPGRIVEATVPGGTPQVDKKATIQVVVSCYECEPGNGVLRPKSGGAPIDLIQGVKLTKERAAHQPVEYEYKMEVIPQRAGNNLYELSWERFCPAAPGDKWFRRDVPVPATGALELVELSPEGELPPDGTPKRGSPGYLMVHSEEYFAVRVSLDKAAAPPKGEPLIVEAVNPGVAKPVPEEIRLYDVKGDGIYLGKHKLGKHKPSDPGKYRLNLHSQIDGLTLKEATVEVGFDYQQSKPFSSMYYGGGWVLCWWPGVEPIDIPNVVTAKNRDARVCKWNAKLCYPWSLEVSKHIRDTDFRAEKTLAAGFDGNTHLKGQLLCAMPFGRFKTASDGSLSGELHDGEELKLGVHTAFSKEVSDNIYGKSDETHRTLESENGLVVQLTMRWEDDQGKVIERMFYAPVSVRPGSLEWPNAVLSYVVLPLLVIGVLLWLALWMKRHRLATVAARQASGDSRRKPAESAPKESPAEKPEKPRRLPPGYKPE